MEFRREEILPGVFQHGVHAAAVAGVAGQGIQMQKRNDWFFNTKHFLSPHGIALLYILPF